MVRPLRQLCNLPPFPKGEIIICGRQMQLWLKLYEFLHSYRRQDVQLYTPMLLDMLNISLSQFRRARQGLIEAGFLSIK